MIIKSRLFLFFIMLTYLLTTMLRANSVQKNAGTVGSVFLRLGVGARATAMGGAYTSVPDGSNSTYGNAAGVLKLQSKEFTLMYSDWFADIKYTYTSYAQPLTDRTGISGSLIYVDYGAFDGRDEIGQKINDPTASNMAFALTFGGRLRENILLGTNLKFIQEKLAGYSANALSADLGLLYYSNVYDIFYGFTIQNLGTKLKFENESFNLPLTYRAGVSINALQNKMIIGIDLVNARDIKMYPAFGMEYNLFRSFSLRGGYTLEKDIGSGYTFGFGINTYLINLDYAFSPYGELGDTHRISFTLKI